LRLQVDSIGRSSGRRIWRSVGLAGSAIDLGELLRCRFIEFGLEAFAHQPNLHALPGWAGWEDLESLVKDLFRAEWHDFHTVQCKNKDLLIRSQLTINELRQEVLFGGNSCN
jgi:hypothetical protein